MIKSLILLLVFLNTVYSRAPSEELVCKNEQDRYLQCQEKVHKELSENPNQDTHIQYMEQTVACLGDLKCKGILKYQKFFTEYQLLTFKIADKMQCATVESHGRLFNACVSMNGEDCDQVLRTTPECSDEEKKALRRYFKTYQYNKNGLQEAVQEEDYLKFMNNFNFDFEDAKYD